ARRYSLLFQIQLTDYSLSFTVFPYIFPIFFFIFSHPPKSTLFPYTTLFRSRGSSHQPSSGPPCSSTATCRRDITTVSSRWPGRRSEEHTSELQSRFDLVCRLLLEKKKKILPRKFRDNTISFTLCP